MYRVHGTCATGSFDATVTEQAIAIGMALSFFNRNVGESSEGGGEVTVSLAGGMPLRLLYLQWALDEGIDR
jgi:hypothetical protein